MQMDSIMLFRIAALLLAFTAGIVTTRIAALSDRTYGGNTRNVLALLVCAPAVLCLFQGWHIMSRRERLELGIGAYIVNNLPPILMVGGAYLLGRLVARLVWRGEQV